MKLLSRISPQMFFLVVAALFGALTIIALPPLLGEDERTQFSRALEIANGTIAGTHAQADAGYVALMDFSEAQLLDVYVNRKPFDAQLREKFFAIPREHTDAPLTYTIHSSYNPVVFLVQVAAIKIADALDTKPVIAVYMARLAVLFVSVGMIYGAIRLMPAWKWTLAILALMPTAAYYRGIANGDAFTNAASYVFIALVFYVWARRTTVSGREIIALALSAFVIAQCKSAYFMLPLLALIIPRGYFTSRRNWLLAQCIIIIPAMLVGLGWMLYIKQTQFSTRAYYICDDHRCASGYRVFPAGQMQAVLENPLVFVRAFVNTITDAHYWENNMKGFVADIGWGNITTPLICYPLLLVAFALTWRLDAQSTGLRPQKNIRIMAGGLFLFQFGVALGLLYLQWSEFGGTIIKGFNGRYFYTTLPLLFLAFVAKPAALAAPEKKLFTIVTVIVPSAMLAVCAVSMWEYYIQ